MKKIYKICAATLFTITLAACNGGGGGGGNGGGGGGVNVNSGKINIGNISTIPTGVNATNTSIVVTNNSTSEMFLQSATYQLVNSTTTTATSSAGSLVDTLQCNKVQARGTCGVMVKAPDGVLDGQYTIVMVFKDTAGKEFKISQIVSYSSSIPSNNGVRFSSINTALHNEAGNSTTLSIPFVLTQDFPSLNAMSKNGNGKVDYPAFSPTISCPGGVYKNGSLCTLFVKVDNTGTSNVLAGIVSVYYTNTSKSAVKSASLKGETGYVFGFPITVTQVTSGNLVTSASNVVINPADGSSAQTITLLNNGNATISGIVVTAANPATVSANTCGATLAAGLTCSFSVNVSSTLSGQTSATVNYSTGATTGDTTGNLSFNIIYIAPSSTVSMTMTSGQGSLTTTPINTTAYYNILVKNTSESVGFTSIAFTSPTLSNAALSYDSSSTCATNGTQVLSAGSSCTLVVKFSPTSAIASSSFTLRAAANYINSGGQAETYSNASITVSYSSITGSAFLYITPNYVSFAIRADGVDTAPQTFTVVNAGLQATNLIGAVAQNPVTTPGLNSPTGTCTSGMTLNPGASCTYITSYGPTTTSVSNVTSKLVASYLPDGAHSAVTAFSDLVFNTYTAALVKISNVVVTGSTGGTGVSATPYLFINSPSPSTQIDFTVTYSNTGTANATNFNVATNNLPVGYVVVSGGTTCGYGATTTTLAVAGTCTVEFKAVNAAGLYNPYALTGPLNVNLPGFSYTDTNTGLNKQQFPTWSGHFGGLNTVYVTANSLAATVSTSTPTWSAGSTNSYTFTSATNGTIITIPITNNTSLPIPLAQLVGFTVGGGGTCTIASGTCTISITSPADMPLTTYNFSYLVSPSGVTTNGIIQQGSFTLN